MPRLILASGSPRRRELLVTTGFRFDVVPASDDAESGVSPNVGPERFVTELATRKAVDVIERIVAVCNKEHTVVLAADTVAVCQDEILGKPRNEQHAREMLTSLSGREHHVYTGIHLAEIGVPTPRPPLTKAIVTTLRMDPLSDTWLDEFLASGKWQGKAGAFGLQDGIGVVHVTDGSETNVVGLPMETLTPLLADFGCVAR